MRSHDLRLIFLKLAVWCQLGEKQGAVQLKHVFVLGFQAPTLFSKLNAVKEGNKLLLLVFTPSHKKVLHLEAGNSTAYLYKLKILFHLRKIMPF